MTRILGHGTHTVVHSGTEPERVVKSLRKGVSREHVVTLDTELEVTRDLAITGVRRALARVRTPLGPSLELKAAPGAPLRPGLATTADGVQLVLEIALQLSRVLVDLHDAGVAHLDLRPANVFYEAASQRLTLIGFDRALVLERTANQLRVPWGSRLHLHYIAPEQTGRLSYGVDRRTDLYGLGATLYSLLTGRPPFASDDPATLLHAHLARRPTEPAELNPLVPPGLSRIVMRLLAKDPGARYASARGVLADLQWCAAGLASGDGDAPRQLGGRDVSPQLQLPTALFGREVELGRLADAWTRAGTGVPVFQVVAGAAGVGKSSLMEAHIALVSASGGAIGRGRCDAVRSGEPYFVLRQALGALMSSGTLGDDPRAPALDGGASALPYSGDTGPLGLLGAEDVRHPGRPGEGVTSESGARRRVERILGVPEDAEVSAGQEHETRLLHSVAEAVRSVARPGLASLLVVDDAQWLDAASLRVLRHLSGALPDLGLQLVLGLRSDEVPAVGVLARWMAESQLEMLEIRELSTGDVQSYFAVALSAAADEVRELAEEVRRKTHGNPLFLREFINSVATRGFLKFDGAEQRWTWSIDEISAMDATANVVELLFGTLRGLPAETGAVLSTAATLGGRFSARVVSGVHDRALAEIVRALVPARTAGLIRPLDASFDQIRLGRPPADTGLEDSVVMPLSAWVPMEFVHDRIHHAARTLVSAEELPALHARCGQWLLDGAGPKPVGSVFDVVDHLRKGLPHLSASTRARLVGLCTSAAREAARQAAWEVALDLFEAALESLQAGETAERGELHAWAAWSGALAANFPAAAKHGRAVFELGAPQDARARAFDSLLMAANAEDRVDEVLRLGREALAPYGIHFPEKPGTRHIILALLRTKLALRGRTPEALVELPEMTDPAIIASMQVIERMVPAAFRMASPLFPLLVFSMVRLSLQHGNMPVSCFGYAAYAITLSGVLGDTAAGFRFGRAALKLVDVLGAESHRPQVLFVLENFLRPWQEPLRESLPGLRTAYEVGPSVGNVFDAMWAGTYHLVVRFLAGDPLPALSAASAAARPHLRKEVGAYALSGLITEVVEVYRRRERDGFTLVGDAFDERAALERYQSLAERTEACVYHTLKVQLAVIMDEPARGLVHLEAAERLGEAILGLPYLPVLTFFGGLLRLRLVGRGADKSLRPVTAALGKLRKWAAACPRNQLHRQLALEAELARVRGRHLHALDLHGQAIEAARSAGFLHEEALLCELASRASHEASRPVQAGLWLREALNAYSEWGAEAKVARLSGAALGAALPGPEAQASVGTLAAVDIAAMTNAIAAIASEIVSDKLVSRLIELLMHNAGATTVTLVLVRDGAPRVVAVGDASGIRALDVPLRGNADLCVRVLERSLELGSAVVVHDAKEDVRLRDDPRTLAGARSMLAFALKHQGQLRGAVYVENREIAGAFNRERLVVLDVLGTHAAAALENARLYGELEAALAAQTAIARAHDRFVPREFLLNFGRQGIQDIVLGDSVQKELTVLFCDVRGFTSLAERLSSSETVQFLNRLLTYLEPHVFENGGFVDSYVGDSVVALFERPAAAIQCALGMLDGLREFNLDAVAQGKAPTLLGIGINTGMLTMATLGGANRVKCTVIGDSVNLASRVEDLTRSYSLPLLVTHHTWDALGSDHGFHGRLVDRVRVRGRVQPVGLYEVLDHEPAMLIEVRISTSDNFEAGRAAYERGDLALAAIYFARCVAVDPTDPIAQLYQARCGAPGGFPTDPSAGRPSKSGVTIR